MTTLGSREAGKCSLRLNSHVPATTLASDEGRTDFSGEPLHKV